MRAFLALPARTLVAGVRLYQVVVSPCLPAVFGPACGCRFHPTCSQYATEALRQHGAVRGTALTLWRLVRCQPLNPGGFDPVPAPGASFPRWSAGVSRNAPTPHRRSRPVCLPVSAR